MISRLDDADRRFMRMWLRDQRRWSLTGSPATLSAARRKIRSLQQLAQTRTERLAAIAQVNARLRAIPTPSAPSFASLLRQENCRDDFIDLFGFAP